MFCVFEVNPSGVVKAIEGLTGEMDDFKHMVLEKSGMFVRQYTIPLTPLDEGYLETSFSTFVEGDRARFNMSGKSNPRSKGYDYAMIQHENSSFNHPVRGEAFYLRNGLLQAESSIVSFIETGMHLLLVKHF